MLFNQFLYPMNFNSAESATALKHHWNKPELRFMAIALHVHVRRLFAITRIKEETVRAAV